MGLSQSDLDFSIRAERKIERVCSEETYKIVFEQLWRLPQTVQHLVIQLGQWVLFLFAPLAERTLTGIPLCKCLNLIGLAANHTKNKSIPQNEPYGVSPSSFPELWRTDCAQDSI